MTNPPRRTSRGHAFNLRRMGLPGRWSRAKRKRVRAVVAKQRAIFVSAWNVRFVVMPAMVECLTGLWRDASEIANYSGFISRPASGPFVDDDEFLKP